MAVGNVIQKLRYLKLNFPSAQWRKQVPHFPETLFGVLMFEIWGTQTVSESQLDVARRRNGFDL